MPGERSFPIADRALELMKAYGSEASPEAFELWFIYASGFKPALNAEVKRIVAQRQILSGDDILSLLGVHSPNERLVAEAGRTSDAMLAGIDDVTRLIEGALGSSSRYGESLDSFTQDLSGRNEGGFTMIRALEVMAQATRDVAAANRTLEGRLKDSRTEVGRLRETLETVRCETLTDSLTGLWNRRHFEAALRSAVADALGGSAPLSLIVIDIDEFKRFNDVHGHLTGDHVLRLVAEVMRDSVETGMMVARFGGEEFSVLLPNVTIAAAHDTAERIRLEVCRREMFKRSSGESLGRITVSLGVAQFVSGDDPTSLLERADLCLLQAKREGRDRTVGAKIEAAEGEVTDDRAA